MDNDKAMRERSRELHEKRGQEWPCATCLPQQASSRPMEILGMTADNEIAFRFGDSEPLTLGESDLIELTNAISRDYLPMWPVSPCRECGVDAVATIEGADYCEPHAASWMMREAEAGRWGK